MKWSWRIGKVAGISVYIHATFLIVVAWLAWRHYLEKNSVADFFIGLGFVGLLFSIVVLHELGHALAARRYGIRTRHITLLPIGGVARLERMPDDPKQELVVALAGPAVNAVIAIILLAVMLPLAAIEALSDVAWFGGDLLSGLFWVNVIMVVFNLIPAFPMDGGRVLRSLLAMRMEYVRATQIAATIGQGLALVLGFIGLFYNPFLVFIALFVWMGAAGEAGMAQRKSALGGIPIRRVMITDFQTLLPQDPLSRAVDHILAGFQQDFPVIENNQVVGMLTRPGLMAGLAQRGTESRVADVMEHEFKTAHPFEMAETVFARLQNCNCRSLPVVQAGELVGILTADNVGEFLMIQAALRGEKPKPGLA